MKNFKSNSIIIIFFAILFILIAIQTFLTQFYFGDELWNFQSIYKMYNGGLIYTDCNVIDTPIFFVLGNFLFQFLGANLVTFKIYNVFIYLAKYILLYFILKKFGIRKTFSVAYTAIFLCLDFSSIRSSANYNMLAITLSLCGILLYFSHYNKKYYNLLQGIVIFLVFFTKQTVGIYYAFGIVLFELLDIGFCKKFWKNQLTKLSTFLPCLGASLILMHLQGNLFDFINLCFGSILEFGSSNHSFSSESLPIFIFMLSSTVFAVFLLAKPNLASENMKRNIKFLLCLSIGMSFNMFPLANKYHINMALTFYALMFIYIIDTILIREILTSKLHTNIVAFVCFIILFILSVKLGFTYFSEYKDWADFDPSHPFYNARILEEDKSKIEQICDYISQKRAHGTQVIVFSYEAAGYMVPLKINNNELDLPLLGNWGYNGIQNVINKISNMKNTEFLIFTDEEECFYQESPEIREFIMNNFEKTGELLNYSIYINH